MTLEERKEIFTVIDTFGEYTLLLRKNLVLGDKYIIAWLFDEDTYEWCQGRYYDNIVKVAIAITNLSKDTIGYSRLEEIADFAITNLNYSNGLDCFIADVDLETHEAEYFGIEDTVEFQDYIS